MTRCTGGSSMYVACLQGGNSRAGLTPLVGVVSLSLIILFFAATDCKTQTREIPRARWSIRGENMAYTLLFFRFGTCGAVQTDQSRRYGEGGVFGHSQSAQQPRPPAAPVHICPLSSKTRGSPITKH